MQYIRDGKASLRDELQLVLFLTEMIDEQRKPDDQSRGTNNDGQRHQTQILPAEEERAENRCVHSLNNADLLLELYYNDNISGTEPYRALKMKMRQDPRSKKGHPCDPGTQNQS